LTKRNQNVKSALLRLGNGPLLRGIKMSNVDLVKLKSIVDATKAGTNVYVGQVVGQPMVAANLIEVNPAVTNPADPTEVLCRSTDAADAYLASNQNGTTDGAVASTSKYEIITNAALPPARKRGNTAGGGGAPSKYPFADLPVNGTFFSANTEHKNGDAVKALGSTVSMHNDKYAEPTGEMKTVTRAVRDKQTKKAQIGPDGKKVTETVQLPVKKYNRKFTIRPVKAGEQYGSWTAPADGALIGRIV
jgi:hypothetical protein